MEKITIVNEKDEIIDYKERGTLTKNDIYRVAGLWIENSKGQVLLAKRAVTKKNDPGMWGPAVAGTIDKGESYEQNIIKETKEEIGLTNTNPKKVVKQRVKSPHNHFTQWFLLKINKPLNEFKIKKDEVAELKWFSKQELKELIKDDSAVVHSMKIFIREYL